MIKRILIISCFVIMSFLSEYNILNAKIYKIDNINVVPEKREIELSGTVQKNKGWVQFLFYAQGYKWLKDECAIVLDVELGSLQNAIALIDWKMWQKLWEDRIRDESIKVELSWDGKENINPEDLIKTDEEIGFIDFIFLGSPYFDQIVLKSSFSGPCISCPLFSLEQEALKKMFVRPSGSSGYYLNEKQMPPIGTKVRVNIKLGKIKEDAKKDKTRNSNIEIPPRNCKTISGTKSSEFFEFQRGNKSQ